jgi:hypothetical protein
VWVAVHAGQDPELKELMLGGELNLVSCPECGLVAYQEHFLIYQEPRAELVAYVYPESQESQAAELQKIMLKGFQDAQDTLPDKDRLHYDPILIFGLEGLIEMLQEEAAMAVQSQVAQALCEQQRLRTILLSPSHARRLHTMRVIPISGDGPQPTRSDVLAGIDKLLALDPVLDRYVQLKAAIQADPAWSLLPR